MSPLIIVAAGIAALLGAVWIGRTLAVRAAMGKIRGIASTAERLGVREITPDELAREIAAGGGPAILDVRMEQEFRGSNGHLAGSRLVPLSELAVRIEDLSDWKERSVVTVCAGGVRSARAVEVLQRAGFRDVRSLAGGLDAWLRSDFPVEG
jgi:sulfur dioxygenase